MGWRAWDNYESEARARWRTLPWRERFSWRTAVVFAVIVAFAAAYLWAGLR
jgi:hypothetical protein